MSDQVKPASEPWPEAIPATVMGSNAQLTVPGKWMYDAPKWARKYQVQIDAKGQPWLYSHADGTHILAVPDAWVGHHIQSNTKGQVMNYGVDLSRMQAPGSLQTNDPGYRMTGQCQPDQPVPLPSSSTSFTSLILPLAIVAAAVLVLVGLRKKG